MRLPIYALCAATVIAYVLVVLRTMHMFQLNSYKAATHIRWLRKNASSLLPSALMLALGVAGIFIFNIIALGIVFLLLCIVMAVSHMPVKKAKKPLVFTARVIRMLVTCGVLLAAVVLAGLLLPVKVSLVFFAFVLALSPIVPVLANIINAPIEALVRQYYISDAKKILRACPNLLVIGITGSYGKTSVKYFLTTLLKAKYNVLMTPESYNTPMGVVKTIRGELRSTHDIFVCEMGAKYDGDIKELCDIVHPTHGILTSIGEQHLETFKTVETIISTKMELADAVAGKGVIFLNGDSELIRANMPRGERWTYGLSPDNDVYAFDIKVTPSGTAFSICDRGTVVKDLQTQLIGEHNVVNLVGAMAVCSYLGVSYDDMRVQLRRITPPPHRLQLIRKGDTVIIDDAYNSNPSGCEAALKTLSLFDGFRILITPGMIELGQKQYELNREFGFRAAGACDFVILVGERQTKPIYEGLVSAGYDESKIYVAPNLNDALAKAYSIRSDRQKIILLENDLPDNY
jgi:UDP-N-acetylmuramoyl-tripeptide--D-alanyl-D-alanine ligase